MVLAELFIIYSAVFEFKRVIYFRRSYCNTCIFTATLVYNVIITALIVPGDKSLQCE